MVKNSDINVDDFDDAIVEIEENAKRVNEFKKSLGDKLKIQLPREGIVREYIINKMIMDSKGYWELIVDFPKPISKLVMYYSASILLSPANYNSSINNQINDFSKPQQDLFAEPVNHKEKIESIHKDYHKQSAMFGIYDFHAEVAEFKNKPDNKQIKFRISKEVANYINDNYDDLYRTSLVLGEYDLQDE